MARHMERALADLELLLEPLALLRILTASFQSFDSRSAIAKSQQSRLFRNKTVDCRVLQVYKAVMLLFVLLMLRNPEQPSASGRHI